jgi:hypothetical protein
LDKRAADLIRQKLAPRGLRFAALQVPPRHTPTLLLAPRSFDDLGAAAYANPRAWPLQASLAAAIPSKISVQFHPDGSDNHVAAVVRDLVERARRSRRHPRVVEVVAAHLPSGLASPRRAPGSQRSMPAPDLSSPRAFAAGLSHAAPAAAAPAGVASHRVSTSSRHSASLHALAPSGGSSSGRRHSARVVLASSRSAPPPPPPPPPHEQPSASPRAPAHPPGNAPLVMPTVDSGEVVLI